MKYGLAAALAIALAAPCGAQESKVQLWRLDCGTIDIDNLGIFSDTGQYAGQKKVLVASCYLIRNGNRYLLWDTGVDGALAGKPKDKEGSQLKQLIVDQLAAVGVTPEDINYVGISHYHYDHTGQLPNFASSTLLIGKGDWEVAQIWQAAKPRFAPWLAGTSKVEPVEGDKDVFGDGKVTMLDMPENRTVGGVPSFNVDRAKTLASHDRFEKLAANLKAKVIIQHEPADVAKLPAFPAAAE
jgi:ribonuclease BN (tRNA processing enzyme)